ncbi:HAD family hydrolase [Amycolatopsis sp. NPDC049252]|uniref:HAD family hydrolase n=1 Tax=Amycolatopsis sp. NPDC049252 TaxID=3363933 RepID=UPI003722D139
MTPEETLTQATALLLDFDGPVCAVFAGIPVSTVADQLRQVLADGGHANLPAPIATSEDPFDVLRYAAELSENDARLVEAAFTAHELEAVSTSTPTAGSHDLIKDWHASNRPIAIVSNNSVTAIQAYIDFYNLSSSIDYISARTGPDVRLLKPSPHLLNQASAALDVAPGDAVFIGDSLTDIEAARIAGVHSIGYANKPEKSSAFADADAVTHTMIELTAAFAESQRSKSERSHEPGSYH